MDFSLGSAQMQSLTVSPGQHGLLGLQSVAFHGIIEFRKGCRYTTGVFWHSWNNGKFWGGRNKNIEQWLLTWATDKSGYESDSGCQVENRNVSASTYISVCLSTHTHTTTEDKCALWILLHTYTWLIKPLLTWAFAYAVLWRFFLNMLDVDLFGKD